MATYRVVEQEGSGSSRDEGSRRGVLRAGGEKRRGLEARREIVRVRGVAMRGVAMGRVRNIV
jgi:hypothetical protein